MTPSPTFKSIAHVRLDWTGKEQFKSLSQQIREWYFHSLETHLIAASDTRAGQCLTPEQHAPHLHAHISPDHRLTLYTYDGLPLLQVEHWPDPATTGHLSSIAKFTRLPPDAPLPFLIHPTVKESLTLGTVAHPTPEESSAVAP
jgi:hypothetical protein